jgi:predicted TIM-barrel fold metal-dependent hydrolase
VVDRVVGAGRLGAALELAATDPKRLRDRIGVDNLLWATDYPHPDSTWPESRRVVTEQFTSCSDDEIQKLVWDDATRLYGL